MTAVQQLADLEAVVRTLVDEGYDAIPLGVGAYLVGRGRPMVRVTIRDYEPTEAVDPNAVTQPISESDLPDV